MNTYIGMIWFFGLRDTRINRFFFSGVAKMNMTHNIKEKEVKTKK